MPNTRQLALLEISLICFTVTSSVTRSLAAVGAERMSDALAGSVGPFMPTVALPSAML